MVSLFSACFLSSVRYDQPLDSTAQKKYQALAALGDMFVIGFSSGLKPRSFTQEARFLLLPWLPTPTLRYLQLFTVGAILALTTILRNGVRILVAQSPYEGFAGAIVKILAGLPGRRVALVVESHGDFEVSPSLQYRIRLRRLHRFLIRRFARFALGHADALRAISESTRRQLQDWAPGKPVTQFPTWTDMDPFLEAGRAQKRNRAEKLFLYAGTLIPLKGVHLLVDAFARTAAEHTECGLVIVGHAQDRHYADAVKREAHSRGLGARVTFLPSIPQAELAGYMARAEALVLPSLSEGLGRVVFEAMACGTPVIGSRVGGITELIRDGETGLLVPPGDVGLLAEKMAWVLTHPEDARMMGEKARDFARSFFSAESYVAAYRDLFVRALESLGDRSHSSR